MASGSTHRVSKMGPKGRWVMVAGFSMLLLVPGVATARDSWRAPDSQRPARTEAPAPQVNGYGSYDRGQYRTRDSLRIDDRYEGGVSINSGSDFLFKGREK